MANKGEEGWSIPDVIDPPESMSVTICIPKNIDHMKAFWGALWELTFWNNWQRNEAHEGKLVADVWYRYWLSWDRNMTDIDCEDGMATCCIDPVIENRIDPVTGRPQIRVDGGAWRADPADPKNKVMLQPPIVGDGLPSTKCDAASNALQHFTDIVSATSSNIATAGSVYALAVAICTVIIEVMVILATGGLGSPLALTVAGMIWGAGTAALAAGQAAFDDYWDSDALDVVFCALYCNIGDNGQFTEDQYNAFLSDVRFELDSSPARDLVITVITAGGAAGLSNMASFGGSADGDCSECGCGDDPIVWWTNANEETTGIFPDEDGYYTVSTGEVTAYPGVGFYGTVSFAPPDTIAPFPNCWRVVDVEWPDIEPSLSGAINCATGGFETPPLSSFCYAKIQWFRAGGSWSIKFRVDTTCP